MHRRLLFLAASLSCLLACGHPRPAPPSQAGAGPLIQGRAKVLELHNELGYALLDIDGKKTYAYWTSDPETAQQSTFTNPGPLGMAVGEGKDPIVHHQDFPAHPGDTIFFRGMMVRQDLYLRGVALVQQKP